MRYFITLSYDGTRYHGWQVQPNGISVQGELQRALSLLLRTDIQVTGAGRTDAGVHARMMVAHFDYSPLQPSPAEGDSIPDEAETTGSTDPSQSETSAPDRGRLDEATLVYKLNRLLPHDIAIERIQPVPDDMHARFSATSRTYHYYLHTRKDPFLCNRSCELHYPLNFTQMNLAAQMLLEYQDFGAFCKSHADVKTTLCHLTKAEWRQVGDHQWMFEISANRFLRNMVRAVVGTLIEVGRGRMTLDDFRRVVEGKRRTDAGESMPAHALYLVRIDYEAPLSCVPSVASDHTIDRQAIEAPSGTVGGAVCG